MAAVGYLLAFLWLLLVTLALVGVNARITIVRRDLQNLAGVGRGPSGPPGADLVPGTVLLLVSETCTGCAAAIDALHDAVAAGEVAGRQAYVLSPDARDRRVRPPLAVLADDDLYRALHPGTTPALIVMGEGGTPAHQAATRAEDLVAHLRRAAGAVGTAGTAGTAGTTGTTGTTGATAPLTADR